MAAPSKGQARPEAVRFAVLYSGRGSPAQETTARVEPASRAKGTWKLAHSARSRPDFKLGDRFVNERNFAIVGRLAEFGRARGRSLLELSLSWLRGRSEVASIIAGATSAQQIRANVASSNWRLTADEVAEIERLAPSHTSQAA
jgi:aryl-alcohol dehydrogenase-like predicted oxidoreductase